MRSLSIVALLGLLSLTTAQMTYYITASSYIKTGSYYDVQITVHRSLPEPLIATASIKLNNSYPQADDSENKIDPTILVKETLTITEPGSATFRLLMPAVDKKNHWAIMTSLEVNCTGAFDVYHSEGLQLEQNSLSVYVQSDKAMYKGGDLVRFRTFATNAQLIPYLGAFNISLLDPDRNILKKWTNQKSDSGLISAHFQLSDQPPLGSWRINIALESGEKKEYMFQVDEYVLPKFKVEVEMPPFIVSVEDKFRATVEAKYTFGKAVKGNASIMIGVRADNYRCREPWVENRYSHREVQICLRRKIFTELNKDGKYDIEMPMKDMVDLLPYSVCNWRGTECDRKPVHLNYQTFFVWVNVTESATGIMLGAEESIRFSGSPTTTNFLQATPNNYKPALAFIGYVQVSQPDGSPVPEAHLMKGDGKKRMVNLTIDYQCPRKQPSYPPGGFPLPPSPRRPGILEDPEDSATSASEPGALSPLKQLTTQSPEEATTKEPECIPRKESKMLEISPGGIMAFEVPAVADEFEQVILRAEFTDKYNVTSRSSKYISPFETKSQKGLRVLTEMEDGALLPGSTALFEVTASDEISKLRYDIIAKGSIVHSMEKIYDTPAMTQMFSLEITEDFARMLAPTPRIVVWYVSKEGEIIADSVSFSVESKLANQVQIKFSTNETKPGRDMNLEIQAYKDSTVGVLVVDQSVKLLASGNDITKEMVDSNLRSYNPNTPYFPSLFLRGGRYGGMCCGCWPYQMSGSDTTELFENSGYIIFTDALVYKKPVPTYSFIGQRGARGPGLASAGGRSGFAEAGPAGPAGPIGASGTAGERGSANDNSGGLQPVEKIRTEFPETWIWLDTVIGPDGKYVQQTTAPDTITSWVASAFALSKDKGLGVSANAKMTVFKPFFASLTLPFALIRGEQFGLKATIFNYLSDPQDVTVTLDKSIYFDVLINGQEVARTARQTLKVPANDAKTVIFWIIPTKIGHMNVTVRAQSSQAADALRRTIPVRPEGTPQEHTESVLISMAQRSSPFVKVLQPKFPPKMLVEDSQRVKVTVIGDIMGPMFNNLGQFVKMPYGCGEQNMVNFVPNIQVLRYLDAAGLNMPQVREKALSYMETGYQRELTYKRTDGSFSAFGMRDPFGSTWLTAFVLKSFAQAVPYIEVNKKHIQDTVQFLVNMQSRDGSFTQPGRTASYLAGGSGTHANSAAYVGLALATARDAEYTDLDFKNEIKKMVEAPLAMVVQFLDSNMTGIETDTYSMAICTYAFTVIGTQDAQAALEKLNKMSFEKNGMRYWADKEEEPEDYSTPWWYWRRTRTYDIEMTSYAMLSNLYFAAPDKSLGTLKWLTSKRNAYGGYYSTQDTVMALQAMTDFALKALSESGKQKMYVRVSADIHDMEFDPITPENSMILQVRELPQSINSLTVMGTGSGSAMVQMTINYNIRDPDPSEDLEVKVDSMEEAIDNKVKVDVCFRWRKKGEESGMGIIEITPLSGYEVDTETLLDNYQDIKRQEKNGQTLVTYWDKFEEKERCLNVTLFKTVDVSNLQEAEIKIYPFYRPERLVSKLYFPRNLTTLNRCTVCPACCEKDAIQVLDRSPIQTNDKDQGGRDEIDMNSNDVNRNKPNARPAQGNNNSAAVFVPSVLYAVIVAFLAMLR